MATVRGIVPDSIHLLITQQVEQLSSGDQAILEAASVAGMTFSVAAVAAAVDLDMSAIEARCATWARQGWLVQDQGTETWPDGTVAACYGFRHALYHEVISGRISPGQRIHLHHHIGHRKERAFADQTQDIAAELAVHFEQAREILRAVPYRHKAAETALQRSAYEEAIAHLTQGLTLLKALPHTPERAQHELTLTLALGGPLAVTKGYAAPEVAQVYTRARELYQQLGATAQLSPVAWRLWQLVVFQICTFTGKYAMVIPPLRGDAHGTRSRDVPLLSQRSGHQRWPNRDWQTTLSLPTDRLCSSFLRAGARV
jgi:hypothetical protein